jgi:hypothetical protein
MIKKCLFTLKIIDFRKQIMYNVIRINNFKRNHKQSINKSNQIEGF